MSIPLMEMKLNTQHAHIHAIHEHHDQFDASHSSMAAYLHTLLPDDVDVDAAADDDDNDDDTLDASTA
ncbi:hypothetical protein F0562_003493 [Nyssa sinensis]|uniref:Uncharacterized protein n=1 Tax=Nyssa sinensis TaxID=561372 RepID=A0A5J5BWN4_9ASTE|nr:hypothetical protein F0562_003493 [Nyssa sinensis]